jgi:hypothetical protein
MHKSPNFNDAVGELMRGHAPLTSRSHAQHGNAVRKSSASMILYRGRASKPAFLARG